MTTSYRYPFPTGGGDRTGIYTNDSTAAISAGDVVVIGDKCAYAMKDIAAGATGPVGWNPSVNLPKATGEGSAIAQGTSVFWDADAGVVTATEGSNTALGFADAAAGDNAATVGVNMS
jgi:predicted RecA/RadA family phage recombinase